MATWSDFVTALLVELADPDTQPNVDALLTWLAAEQPPNSPNAQFNPLNIQTGGAAHDSTTPGGQYNFASFDAGVQATASFLGGSYYAGILTALRRGDSAVQTVAAIQASPWAASHYNGRLVPLLSVVQSNRNEYLAGVIAGAGGPDNPTPEEDDMNADEMELVLADSIKKGIIPGNDQIDLVVIEATKPINDKLAAIAAHLGVTLPTT